MPRRRHGAQPHDLLREGSWVDRIRSRAYFDRLLARVGLEVADEFPIYYWLLDGGPTGRVTRALFASAGARAIYAVDRLGPGAPRREPAAGTRHVENAAADDPSRVDASHRSSEKSVGKLMQRSTAVVAFGTPSRCSGAGCMWVSNQVPGTTPSVRYAHRRFRFISDVTSTGYRNTIGADPATTVGLVKPDASHHSSQRRAFARRRSL